MIVAEEELKVEEEWVRSEYAEVDIEIKQQLRT
jgi:hypothetical protein